MKLDSSPAGQENSVKVQAIMPYVELLLLTQEKLSTAHMSFPDVHGVMQTIKEVPYTFPD